jgi:transcriptional regulator with XRE-family HTH domain
MKTARLLSLARRRAGLTQRELATIAGVAQPAIARIERGRISPSVATLDRLLRATGHVVELAPLEGAGVDRTLIRAALARTAEERLASAGEAGRRLLAFRVASRTARTANAKRHASCR